MAKKMKLPQSMANIQSPFRRLFTLIIFILSSVWCSEASTLIDGIYYNLNDDATASVTSGSSYAGEIVIPAEVSFGGKSYAVTSVGLYAFCKCGDITSVSIPGTV